jgi:glycine/serine hydroxymethyltransferase
MGVAEMRQIAGWMDRVISDPQDDTADTVDAEGKELTSRFPAPGITR